MSYTLNYNQTIPFLNWTSKNINYTETKLSAFSELDGAPGRILYTCKSSDSGYTFSFFVQGGFTAREPKWNFEKFYVTSGVEDPEDPTVSIVLVENSRYADFTITTSSQDSGGRSYRFLFSSATARPYQIRKTSGTNPFADGEYLTVNNFYVYSISNSLAPGYVAPMLSWNEYVNHFTDSTTLKTVGGFLPSSFGRHWVTFLLNDTSENFSFFFDGGYNLDKMQWRFERQYIVSDGLTVAYSNISNGTLMKVIITLSTGRSFEVTMQSGDPKRSLWFRQLTGNNFGVSPNHLSVKVFYFGPLNH